MNIKRETFKELLDRAKHPSVIGWAVYDNVRCQHCGFIWIAIAAVWTKGKECPYCGHYDEDFMWLGLQNGLYGEGGYLAPAGWETARLSRN